MVGWLGWDGDGDGDGGWGWGGWVGGWVGIGLFSTSLSQMPCQGYLFSMSTIHFATFTVTGFCRICQLYFSHLHQIILSTSNLRTLMSVCFHCQGYLFSMPTIHFATFTVTGFCRICQFSLFSQVSTVGLHLDNSVSNAMPGLLVFHVHQTFCNFHSHWILQDLPTFFFSLVSTSILRTLMSVCLHHFTVTGCCRI